MKIEPPRRGEPEKGSPETTVDPLSPVEIGSRVKAARRQAALSQTQLAESLGITYQQVQKYEKGVNRISAATLARIAALLDVSTERLMGDNSKPRQVSLEGLITMESIRLLRIFDRLDPETRTTVLSLLEKLAPPA